MFSVLDRGVGLVSLQLIPPRASGVSEALGSLVEGIGSGGGGRVPVVGKS